jgi:hypothetical protein
MDESHQDPSSSLSLQQLLEELENFTALEAQRNGAPWIKITKLSELFYEKYSVLPEKVAEVQGYSWSLRNLLKSSRRFSIYGTPIPQEFYVALFQSIAQASQVVVRDHYVRKHSAVDGYLWEPMHVGSSQTASLGQGQKHPEHQPNLVTPIQSVDDLEVALIALAKSLIENSPQLSATLGELSKKFCDCYRQPIRVVMRNVCPDLKLIELLQVIPSLQTQKMDTDWQITIATDLIKRPS